MERQIKTNLLFKESYSFEGYENALTNDFIFKNYISPLLKNINKNQGLKYYYHEGAGEDSHVITLPLEEENMHTPIKKISLEALVVSALRAAKEGVFFNGVRYQRKRGINLNKSGSWLIASKGHPYMEIVDCFSLPEDNTETLEIIDHCGGILKHIVYPVKNENLRLESEFVLEINNKQFKDENENKTETLTRTYEAMNRRAVLVKIYENIVEWYKLKTESGIVQLAELAKH